jgi:peroxiredoxin
MKFLQLSLCLLISGLQFPVFSQKTFTYEITGELKGLKNDTLYLSIMSGKDGGAPERILIAGKNDKFSYTGEADRPILVWAQTTLKRGDNGNFTFFIEKGKIKIQGKNDDLTRTKITGTPSNDDYTSGNARMNSYYDQMAPLRKKLKEIADTSNVEYRKAFAAIGSLYDSISTFQIDFVTQKHTSLASGMYLMLIADKIPVFQLERLYNNLGEEAKKLGVLAKLPSRIEAKKRSVIGSNAPDFTMKDINGNDITLSNYKGKYVLLDFWASWCVPCRKDNPYVKAAYEKLKDKNFVVIGVSVDEDGTKWKQAIEKDQLPWIHISDLKKENRVAHLYGVQPIPDNFLIGPDGKIIERGLHGQNIEKTLNRIIK